MKNKWKPFHSAHSTTPCSLSSRVVLCLGHRSLHSATTARVHFTHSQIGSTLSKVYTLIHHCLFSSKPLCKAPEDTAHVCLCSNPTYLQVLQNFAGNVKPPSGPNCRPWLQSGTPMLSRVLAYTHWPQSAWEDIQHCKTKPNLTFLDSNSRFHAPSGC